MKYATATDLQKRCYLGEQNHKIEVNIDYPKRFIKPEYFLNSYDEPYISENKSFEYRHSEYREIYRDVIGIKYVNFFAAKCVHFCTP